MKIAKTEHLGTKKKLDTRSGESEEIMERRSGSSYEENEPRRGTLRN